MDPIPLTQILSTLQDILTHNPTLSSSSSSSSISAPSILPPSIPSLPITSFHLPSQPSSTSSSSQSLQDLSTYLQTHILPHLSLSSLSPRYYGFVTGGTTPAALLADWLASIYDQNASVHLPKESIATNVEVAALNQLVDLFGLPRQEWGIGGGQEGGKGTGTFTTGATASNVLGLAMGREWVLGEKVRRKRKGSGEGMVNGAGAAAGAEGREEGVVSCADSGVYEVMREAGVQSVKVLTSLPHSSVGKAASLVGLGRGNVVSVLKEGTVCEIDLQKLEMEVRKEGQACVLVVSAGEVNTGAYATTSEDMMKHIRRLCDENGVWIHADGAFGLFARLLVDEGKEYETLVRGVQGLELADSITGDGHKLLNVPYDCGFFFTRHKALAEQVFRNAGAAYLSGGGGDDGIQSPLNIGNENSRRFRALPVHATLTAYGKDGYIDMLKRQIALARRVTRWLSKQAEYEVLPKGASLEDLVKNTFMIVLFRAKDETVNQGLVQKVKDTGRIYVSGTAWEGKPAARIAVSNWQVDVERDGLVIEEVLKQVIR